MNNSDTPSIRLHKNKVVKKTLLRSLPWIFVASIVAILIGIIMLRSNGSLNWLAPTIPSVVFMSILILCVNYLYQRWYYEFYHFSLSPDYLLIRKNPVKPNEVSIPYQRINDIYVDQDIFDKFFGLYDLHINKNGKKTEIHIDGLTKESAEKLRSEIHDNIQKHSVKHTPIQPAKILGQR